MRLRDPRLWIALFSGTTVLVLALVDVRRRSPGPLASVHGREDALSGRFGCSECHGGLLGNMTSACLDCHSAVEQQMDERTGLHGVFDAEKANRCALCHSEHHGARFAIVNQRSFVEAGAEGPRAFDHELIGFLMEGRHTDLGCVECHANAEVDVLPKGEHRFMGLEQRCTACHDDPHEGRMVIACTQCHGQDSFEELASSDHDRWLPLTGGHGALACAECHASDTRHSLDFLGGAAGRGAEARACADCHASPHARGFLAGVGRSVTREPGATCGACHAAEHTRFREPGLEVSKALHARSGFPLITPHEDVECAACHAPGRAEFADRYPGRHRDACASCHEDPHGGQFAGSPFASEGCIGCHDRQFFEPHGFGSELHARTELALTGTHLEAGCEACHEVPAAGAPRAFRGTDAACGACHADAHEGFFDGRGDAAGEDVACSTCHLTTRFADLPQEGFDHERWTDFALLGAHAQAECASCHPTASTRDEAGRAFGRVAEHYGTVAGCVSCHDDPHRGTFDAPGMPLSVDGRTDCARCHVETSFRMLDGFQHGRWTGFALRDAHAGASCSDCHAPLRRADGHGRMLAAAPGRECSACHDDSHAGQFELRGATDCERCHQSAASFSKLVFRHDRDSRFKLGDAHADLACSACHLPDALEGPAAAAEGGGAALPDAVVRYRPLAMQCVDCHGAQEGPLRKRGRRIR